MNRLDAARTQWHRWQRRFDRRAVRERVLFIVAAEVIVLMLADRLVLSPAQGAWATARRQATTAQQQLVQRRNESVQRDALAMAAGEQLRRDLAAWRARVTEDDAALRQQGGELVPATDMVTVLQALLDKGHGLKLLSLDSLPRSVVAVTGASAASGAAQAGALYRHGVRIAVEGSFADLHAYCEALEAMPKRVLWGGMTLDADHHPQLVMALKLYTLSLDSHWLEL
jgi:MSHA biogenesis protein MshJ